MRSLAKLFGDANAREVKRLAEIVREIDGLEPAARELSTQGLKEKSLTLRNAVESGAKTLDDILPEAFALVREAARRTLGQRHFGVQLMAGIALHEGKIVEMRTGEGKTLAATAPVYLNALLGDGVHVVTVNDYLARRDTVWMGQIYDALGMSVGCVTQQGSYIYDPTAGTQTQLDDQELDRTRDISGGFKVVHELLRPVSKREAYAADITYGTNNEFGFDYLRDNLAYAKSDVVQRPPNYAIVDEVDSILIDEARTPLIISAPDEDAAKLYKEFSRFIPRLRKDVDYTIDEKFRAVLLTDEGMAKIESLLGRRIYEESNLVLIHHVEEALKAHFLFERDKDYVVKNGEVIIVDEFTGRLMHGRRYTGGLHQALEAKEGVPVKQESRTVATITFQNLFRMYPKLAGMTGTAATSAEEFYKVYKLEVVVIPTNRPMIRKDLPDLIFRTERGKFRALVRDIKERHESGQPVLVGTVSIQKNELISQLLRREGIRHEILNAKNHEREGEIIAQAGRLGAVTIATNMAGRGVDIILGGNPPNPEEAEKVRELGGLYVIGTERHEARRIDNQLRGRSGRQGDPGSSRFYVSMEDDLMRIFGSDRIKNIMARLGIPEDEPIQNPLVSKAIEAAQSKIEGFNFDIRKHVLDYDDVLTKQRDTLYQKRKSVLYGDSKYIKSFIEESAANAIHRAIELHTANRITEEWNIEELKELMKTFLGSYAEFDAIFDRFASEKDAALLENALKEAAISELSKKEAELGPGFPDFMRMVILRVIDILWMDHLETMEGLRDSVRLRAYGQRDPLVEYKSEGFRLWRELLANLDIYVFQWALRAMPRST